MNFKRAAILCAAFSVGLVIIAFLLALLAPDQWYGDGPPPHQTRQEIVDAIFWLLFSPGMVVHKLHKYLFFSRIESGPLLSISSGIFWGLVSEICIVVVPIIKRVLYPNLYENPNNTRLANSRGRPLPMTNCNSTTNPSVHVQARPGCGCV